MRIALISDLHGNAVALRAVLADIERVGVDRIICLGDVATLGPAPHEILHVLRERAIPCILGNHDEFLLDAALIHRYTEAPEVVTAVEQCRDALGADELAFVRTFAATMELELGSGQQLLLFHGSPRSHMENLLATTPKEVLEPLLAGHHATVMAGGHTHIQMLRQHRGMLLVNPGSVGMPFQEFAHGGPPTVLCHAEYAIVEADHGALGVHLRRVPLSRSALRAAMATWDSPLRRPLLRAYAD